MDIPDLVKEQLGDEEIQAGVSIGDEDAVCLTPTRTLVYRSEGILSDEGVETYPHDIERLSVKEGRRKTKFTLEYVEGPEEFSVPSNRGETVLELLLQGILRLEGVLDEHESVVGVYRFTELTLVIAEKRILKYVGSYDWDDDFETYSFESVTGLEFERASNATSIAIEIDGRPQRVKVPNETARIVQQTIEKALFAYYGVDSLEELNRTVGESSGRETEGSESDGSGDIGFESGIDPLVTDSAEEQLDDLPDTPEPEQGRTESQEGNARPDRMDVSVGSDANDAPDRTPDRQSEPTEADDERRAGDQQIDPSHRDAGESGGQHRDAGESGGQHRDAGEPGAQHRDAGEPGAQHRDAGESTDPGSTGTADRRGSGSRAEPETESRRETGPGSGSGPAAELDYEPASQEDLAAVSTQLEELTEAVERQNELLKRQHKAIKNLVSELRSD